MGDLKGKVAVGKDFLMGRKSYFLVAGIIFMLVAVSYALRIYMEWLVTIAN